MKAAACLALLVGSGVLLQAQEREVPGDSERISVPGCAKGPSFIVAATPEHEPVRSDIEPGRRFRLSGPKTILNDIKRREGRMIEVTGLVRKGQLARPAGVAIAGGRIRIGGGLPQAPIDSQRPAPGYNQVVLDVEGWRLLTDSCPAR